MNTKEILDVLNNDLFTSKYCYSVLPLNHFLENSFPNSSFAVVNYDDCDKPGSHWVAIFIDENRNVEYFDSYGIMPLDFSIISKLEEISNGKEIIFNLARFQGTSSVCGQYCLVYLLLRTRGVKLRKIKKILLQCSSFPERDYIVNHFINQSFGILFSSLLKVYDNKFMTKK